MTGILGSVVPWVTLVVGVIIGVLTSLAAAYVKPLIDNKLAKYSSRVRNRNEARRTEWEAEVSSLVGDSEKLHQLSMKVNTCLLTSNHHLLLASWPLFISFALIITKRILGETGDMTSEMIVIVVSIISFIFAMLLFSISWEQKKKAERYFRMVAEAEKQVTNGGANAESDMQHGSE